MVIFDDKNNYNNEIKGMLYMNMMDVDYLMSEYSSQSLRERLPLDYVELFEYELEQRRKEDKLSEQYYSILSLGIENVRDEELLKIIKSEVQQGNLFTRSVLKSIEPDDLKRLIDLLKSNLDKIAFKELYKLRSYMMSEYISNEISRANVISGRLNIYPTSRQLLTYYNTIISNLELMGLSSEIVESDYFEKVKR